jgi:hypothetical protein
VGRRLLTAALVVAAAAELRAQDRPVYVVDTDPAPAMIQGGTFFLVGGQLALSVSNRHSAPILVTLRAWVFDQAWRLKGTHTHCLPEWLDRGIRRVVTMAVEVRNLTATDNVVVGIDRVAAGRHRWQTMASPEAAVAEARRAGAGGSRPLRMDATAADEAPAVPCPCECEPVAAECEAHCGATGLRAFTCSPIVLDGCSASCSCK